MLLMFNNVLNANKITIDVGSSILIGKNTTDDFVFVEFDIVWENTWKGPDAEPFSWDAAWIFVKYRISVANGGDGVWKHATLNSTGYSCYPSFKINMATDGTGAFIYSRTDDLPGPFWGYGTDLRWNYGIDGVSDDAPVDIQVFAVEMVYVQTGSFYVGSGGTENGAFYKYPTTTNPYQVTSEGEINVGTVADELYYTQNNVNNGDQSGPVPAAFPKGYAGFYCMKYEISQQQYVDFLNCLTQAQANNRMFIQAAPNYRYGITGSSVGNYSTTNPNVPANSLSWGDVAAYLDWSGLRPMTELEYEKACRGPFPAVANEYAWGTATIANSENIAEKHYSIINIGGEDETISANLSLTAGNAVYARTVCSGCEGPLRTGIFAGELEVERLRMVTGAASPGIMEMTGNLWERAVSVGTAEQRAFTGLHGDGEIDASGNPDVSGWPGTSTGIGLRGGSYTSNYLMTAVSARHAAIGTVNSAGRVYGYGGRGVRSEASLAIQEY